MGAAAAAKDAAKAEVTVVGSVAGELEDLAREGLAPTAVATRAAAETKAQAAEAAADRVATPAAAACWGAAIRDIPASPPQDHRRP